MRRSILWRKSVNIAMIGATGLCATVTVASLILILGFLAWKGAHYITWAFLTQLPAPVGELGGGMGNAIVGSGKMLLLASVTGIPVGLMAGIYLAEFGGRTISFMVRYAADLLNGVPSIVTGIFIYTVVVLTMGNFSALAGGLALGVMMIPIVVRSTEDFILAVPGNMLEGALALGVSKWRGVATVVLPAARRGIMTGILLSLARVAGETAPLLFTSFNNQYWSRGWDSPIASLPVVIYTYAVSPYKSWHDQAWAAGFVLLALVLLVNIGAHMILSRQHSVQRG
ncbi:MAG TPA: phosphate ABC transporter permease PstA [Terriglobia bacterium]|nr:phosphate ABC transporter permease PstA [Terriglobia bacterium]